MTDSFDVFLSHHHDDGAIVAGLALALATLSIADPWLSAALGG